MPRNYKNSGFAVADYVTGPAATRGATAAS